MKRKCSTVLSVDRIQFLLRLLRQILPAMDPLHLLGKLETIETEVIEFLSQIIGNCCTQNLMTNQLFLGFFQSHSVAGRIWIYASSWTRCVFCFWLVKI